MAKMTETVAMQLDPHALRRIDDHPDVQPLAEAHYRLQADQRRLTAALVEVRKIIVSAEREGGDPLVPSRTLRDARRQAEALQDQLIEIQEQLSQSHEALEIARDEARGELRPVLRHEAVQALTIVRMPQKPCSRPKQRCRSWSSIPGGWVSAFPSVAVWTRSCRGASK
jgi:hypothetical protein